MLVLKKRLSSFVNNLLNVTFSDRGKCECGQCQCDSRQNTAEKIFGKFCQCDNYSCRTVNGLICSGKGNEEINTSR